MKFLSFLALVSSTEASSSDSAFLEYITKHGKSYGTSAEYEFRKAIFDKRIQEHKLHNEKANQTSTVGLNKFSDWTEYELKKLFGYRGESQRRNYTMFEEGNIAESIDWRKKGGVTAVGNEAQCAACWAFAAVGAVEHAHWRTTGELVPLSVQQLVDCDKGNGGCEGGMMDAAFDYAKEKPLLSWKDYPYIVKEQACQFDQAKAVAKVTTYLDVKPNSVSQLKAALNTGAVAIAVNGYNPPFWQYTGGIISDPACGTKLDHGVLLVGYGKENDQEFWIVKNEWTTDWGENGFVRIAIKEGPGVCGVQMVPSLPEST